MSPINKTARLAGFFYLMFLVTFIFASAVRSKLFAYGDATVTAQNILSSDGLFRLGFVSEILSAVFFLLSAWALYTLLKPVNKNLALLFVFLNLGGVAVECVSLLNQFAALLLLSGADYLKVFQVEQLQSLSLIFLNLYKNGLMIAQIFYGVWLFPLGYLVFKSGFLPRILGLVMMIHCVGWLLTFLQFFLFPSFTGITYLTYPLGFISEAGLTLWLLIMGVKDQKTA